jgi:hypothetical protein
VHNHDVQESHNGRSGVKLVLSGKAPDNVKGVEMTKTPAEYIAQEPTANQEQFLAWVLAETGLGATLKTAVAKDAFALGVKAAGLYSRYQASKRPTATEPTAPAPKKTGAKKSAA